jgi:hypothetical protein
MTSSASGAELALNYADGKLYFKNSSGVVTLLAGSGGGGPAAGSNTQVQYNNGGVFGASANMTFDGTTLTVAGLSNTGNTTLGNASADTLTVNSTITSNLIFTDNTYDIGASGATRPRNLYTSGIGLFGGTLFTQSVQLGTSRLTLRDNSLEEYAANSNSAVAVNYTGYLAGTTQFRDFDIYNGKAGFIATFEGATSRFGLNNQNPSYLFDMTGQGRVLSGSGASGATIPANNLFVIDSSANAGFGLAIPSTGNIVGGFYVNAGTNQYDGGIDYEGTTRTLNLRSAGASRVIVDSAGSVGVGAAPTSSGRLSLQITDAAEGYYTSNVRTALGVNFVYNANNLYIGSNYASYFELDGTSGAFKWFNAPTGTAGGVATFTQTMTLDTNGVAYIGGTSGIGSRLNLIKDTNSAVENLLWLRNSGTGYKGARITFGEYSTINGYITNQYISSGPIWCTDIGSTNSVRFFTGSDPGTQRADIDSTGKLTVGSISTSLSNLLTVLSSVASGGSTMTVHNINDSGGGVTYAGINFLVGSDNGTCSIRSIRTNAGSDYQSALQFLTNPAGATIVPTLKMTINPTGAVVLQGGTTSANGTGITFPGTQNQSSNANTLDDYEEGSWTPTLIFGSSSTGITYIYQSGNYVKIGRQVTVWATIYLSSKGSATGDAQFSGLPFAPSDTFYNEQHGVAAEVNNLTFSGYLTSRVGGTDKVQVFSNISGSAQAILNNTNYQNTTSLAVTVTYTTNA